MNPVTSTSGNGDNKEWQNPQNPEAPADARDKEQVERQYEEAKRRKDNLTETDHIDKEKKGPSPTE